MHCPRRRPRCEIPQGGGDGHLVLVGNPKKEIVSIISANPIKNYIAKKNISSMH